MKVGKSPDSGTEGRRQGESKSKQDTAAGRRTRRGAARACESERGEAWHACTITAARITTAPPTGRSTTTSTSPRSPNPPFPFRTAASRSSAARLVRCPPPPCAFAFDELVIFHCYGAAFRIAQRPGRWTLNQDLGRAPRRLNPLSCAQVVALNESVPGSVKAVFKPWEQRLDTSGVCTTDAVPCPLMH